MEIMQYRVFAFVWLIAAMLVIGVSGCGPRSKLPKTVKADGVILMDGAPIADATITFIADTGNYHATATSDKDGKFSLRAFPEKTGAVPGSYKVEVNKTLVTGNGTSTGDEPAVLNVGFGLPEKYASMVTSGLTGTVPESGTSDLKIELSAK
jgi:hypothetical protein